MRPPLRYTLLGLGALLIVGMVWVMRVPLESALARVSIEARAAATFFVTSITAADIQKTYSTDLHSTSGGLPLSSRKVRLLIVPGHQPTKGGAEIGALKERDLVVPIAEKLATYLVAQGRYTVTVARSQTDWDPVLKQYVADHQKDIELYREAQQAEMRSHLAEGHIHPLEDPVAHIAASNEGSLQLYGINKWASEQDIDIVLHLHLNDTPTRRGPHDTPFQGFALYIPDRQYSNASASRALAEAIAARLSAYHATSTMPKERFGVVEDQELIAVGSNNSVDSAALLIEYGYLSEPQFAEASTREAALKDYAYATYLGLQDFMHDPVPTKVGTNVFPADWSSVTVRKGDQNAGVYALQSALRHLGFYPPTGKNLIECPISGRVGPCTVSALSSFQREHGLEVTGTLGPQTRAALSRDLTK